MPPKTKAMGQLEPQLNGEQQVVNIVFNHLIRAYQPISWPERYSQKSNFWQKLDFFIALLLAKTEEQREATKNKAERPQNPPANAIDEEGSHRG